MPRYMLTMYQPDGPPPPPEMLGPIMRNLAALNAEMQAAGVWVSAVGLSPAADAMVVRVRGGKALATDGPFVESKEHVGGFTVIEAPDLGAALKWSERLAGVTTLPIEVRAFAGGGG
jgi:hypothetical protein